MVYSLYQALTPICFFAANIYLLIANQDKLRLIILTTVGVSILILVGLFHEQTLYIIGRHSSVALYLYCFSFFFFYLFRLFILSTARFYTKKCSYLIVVKMPILLLRKKQNGR